MQRRNDQALDLELPWSLGVEDAHERVITSYSIHYTKLYEGRGIRPPDRPYRLRKSTLLKTFNGIIPHESGGTFSGSIKINGIETRDSNQMELSRAIGLVFQNPDDQIFSTSVEDA